MQSTLTKNQAKIFEKVDGDFKIIVTVRYDDRCNNGHNTFSIVGETYYRKGNRWICDSAGQITDEIIRYFPQLQSLYKWHLVSSDGPMHYVGNALYWAGHCKQWCNGAPNDPPNWDHFKSTIVYDDSKDGNITVWQQMTKDDMTIALNDRLQWLMEDFRNDMIKFDFIF